MIVTAETTADADIGGNREFFGEFGEWSLAERLRECLRLPSEINRPTLCFGGHGVTALPNPLFSGESLKLTFFPTLNSVL